VKNPEEIAAACRTFMERAGHYYKNWDESEKKWEGEDGGHHPELEKLEKSRAWPTWRTSPSSPTPSASRRAPPAEELRRPDQPRHQVLAVPLRFLNLGYAAYVLLLDFVQKLLPSIRRSA